MTVTGWGQGIIKAMRPKICFLSRDPSDYSAALYQNDFLVALKKVADVHLVSSSASFERLRQTGNFDFFLFGHQWLDEAGQPLLELDFDSLKTERKVFFLNKEYANLEKKT